MTPIADPATQAAAALKMALRAVLLLGQAPGYEPPPSPQEGQDQTPGGPREHHEQRAKTRGRRAGVNATP